MNEPAKFSLKMDYRECRSLGFHLATGVLMAITLFITALGLMIRLCAYFGL